MVSPLLSALQQYWGYSSFRPLQEQVVKSLLAGRDACVVMPTGGGKSLCYQAPAVARGGTTVVVSPLISLMKDQVDSLQACGVPALQIDSSLSSSERWSSELDLVQGGVRLLFVSPERLALPDFCNLLRRIKAAGAVPAVFTTYLFAFEATAALLIIAVVGAVLLARRERPPSGEEA